MRAPGLSKQFSEVRIKDLSVLGFGFDGIKAMSCEIEHEVDRGWDGKPTWEIHSSEVF